MSNEDTPRKGGDKRFEVSFKLDIREVKNGIETPFFDSTIAYHDLGYDGVVAVESVLTDALGQLTAAGFVQAQSMGLGESLQLLQTAGIGPAIPAKS